MNRLVEASAAEAEAANAVWQAAQTHAASPEETSVAAAAAAADDNDSQAADNHSEGSDGEGDVRLHPRAV